MERSVIMRLIKKIADFLFNDELELRFRLLSAIFCCVMTGAVIGLVPMVLESTEGWWINLIVLSVGIICQYSLVKFKIPDAASIFLAVVGIAVIMPSMYFFQGGINSGVPLWMVFAAQTAFIMLPGKKRYIAVSLSLVVFSCCILVEYYFPDTVLPISSRAAIFADIFTSFIAMIVIFLIILWFYMHAYEKERDKLKYVLCHDALTGVENRYAFEDKISELNRKPLPEDLAIVSADVNSLKLANDSFGHAAGDELLLGAAQIFIKTFGSMGTVYRTGGDEFQAIIYTDRSLEDLQKEFDGYMNAWSGRYIRTIHISTGFAFNRIFKAANCDPLIRAADESMYKNKAAWYRMNGINRRQSRI